MDYGLRLPKTSPIPLAFPPVSLYDTDVAAQVPRNAVTHVPGWIGELQMSTSDSLKFLPMKRIAFFGAVIVAAVLVMGGAAGTKCRFCGSTSYGSGCPYSATGKHQHRGVAAHCDFCGSTSYGSGCPYSPWGKHRHGGEGARCVWCGSTSYGSGCPYSSTHRHEH